VSVGKHPHALIVTPRTWKCGPLPGDHIGLTFDIEGIEELLPALDLFLRLSPDEALALGSTLRRKALEAGAVEPPSRDH